MSEQKLSLKESKLKRQIDRYRRKTQPVIIARFLTVRHEKMVERYREYALTARRLEEIVQKVTEEVGVPALYRLWYLNFAREVEKTYRQYQNRNLAKELTIVQFKWATRGLNPLLLKQIETAIENEKDWRPRANDEPENH
ncbi:MAG: hypothetical protein ACUVUD_06770 [bacterium]